MSAARWKTPALNEINLGDITDMEQGESRDDATAAKFFLKDAERGDAAAQLNLAMLLADGAGVAKDEVSAFMWAELAASRASGQVRDNALKLQAHLERSLSSAAREKAREAARRWRHKSG
jgi:TPR repeat protein